MGRSVSTPMANTTQSMTRCDNLQTRCPARPVSNRACSITAGEITLLRPASRSTTVSASGVGSKQLPCRVIVIASLKGGSYTHPRLQEAMTCAKTNGIGPRPVFATLLVYDFQSQESCGLRHNTRKTQGFSTKNCDIQRRGFLTLNNHATYTRTVVVLNPYAPGRSNLSDIYQKSTNCHPKGRSRISAHVAPHVCDDGIVVIDPPPRKRVQANPWLPIEPASSSPRPWPSLTCISGQSRLLPQQRGRPPAAGPVRKGHHR